MRQAERGLCNTGDKRRTEQPAAYHCNKSRDLWPILEGRAKGKGGLACILYSNGQQERGAVGNRLGERECQKAEIERDVKQSDRRPDAGKAQNFCRVPHDHARVCSRAEASTTVRDSSAMK